MTLIGIRTHGSGYVVGPIHARLRDERLGTEVRPARHAGTPREALATLSALLAQARHAEEHGYDDVEPPTEAAVSLHKGDREALALLKRHGSLTPREYEDLVGKQRLASRVWAIRRVHGFSSVERIWEKNGNGGKHARYHWRGHDSQTEMFG